MDRDKKALSAQEKLEMDLMAEAELGKLQRQYRIMEGDRKAFSGDTNTKLAKQRHVINSLKKEQNNLLTDLRVTMCQSNKRKDLKLTLQLNGLLDEHDSCNLEIKKLKTHLEEVDKEIKKLEKKIKDWRSKEITDEQLQKKVKTGERMVQTLENKLGTEIKRFCSVLAENGKLREEIEHLLIERSHFNAVWEKLLENLNQGKKLMLDLIEQATVAYDQREEWCSKLHALRVRSTNDLMLHTQEMKELQRQLDHDNKLYDFLGVKGQRRVMKDLEEKEMKRREMEKEEIETKKIKYDEMLKEIQEIVNEKDLNKLSAQYFKQEEENFALFNYVNELNHEIEVIADEVSELEENIAAQKELSHERNQQQKETVDVLKENLEIITYEANEKKNELNGVEAELAVLLKGIQGLFNLLKCDNTPILELLGENSFINDSNVILYLGILEKNVAELTANMFLKEKSLFNKRRKAAQAVKEENMF